MPSSRHRNTRDVLSARPLAIAADTPVITSAGGTEPNLLAALRDGGLPVGTDPREFRTEAEFAARVTEALSDGLLMSMEYPQPTALYPDERSVKSAELVGYLNNKASISTSSTPASRPAARSSPSTSSPKPPPRRSPGCSKPPPTLLTAPASTSTCTEQGTR